MTEKWQKPTVSCNFHFPGISKKFCHFPCVFHVFWNFRKIRKNIRKMTEKWQKNDKNLRFLAISIFLGFPKNSVIFLSFSLCFSCFLKFAKNKEKHKENNRKMTEKWQKPRVFAISIFLGFPKNSVIFLSFFCHFPCVFHVFLKFAKNKEKHKENGRKMTEKWQKPTVFCNFHFFGISKKKLSFFYHFSLISLVFF